jgi:hypothetical protein
MKPNCQQDACRNALRRHWEQFHKDFVKHFWAKVDMRRPDDCWLWQSTISSRGYGSVTHKGKVKSAHRTAYELAKGPIPAGHFVCHRCDTPACCNPAHLFAGTNSDNQLDSSAKGRMPSKRGKLNPMYGRVGHRHPRSKLTETQVRTIKRLYNQGSYTYKQLGEKFGVITATVSHIMNGRIWRHVS